MRLPAPTAAASLWQCASAPARPPKFAPLPGPALVTKKVIWAAWGALCAPTNQVSTNTVVAAKKNQVCLLFIRNSFRNVDACILFRQELKWRIQDMRNPLDCL